MELNITVAQEAKLQVIAERAGKTPADLLVDAATSVIEIDEHHWMAIDRAIAQADRGEFIEEEEMDTRVARMLAR